MLRAATPHFPRLHEMLKPLCGAISNNKFITRIDKALSEGDFVGLWLRLGLSEYVNLLGPSNQSAFLYSPLDSSSGPQSVVLQEPNLPDLEPYLQVEHAELIKVFEKKLAVIHLLHLLHPPVILLLCSVFGGPHPLSGLNPPHPLSGLNAPHLLSGPPTGVEASLIIKTTFTLRS